MATIFSTVGSDTTKQTEWYDICQESPDASTTVTIQYRLHRHHDDAESSISIASQFVGHLRVNIIKASLHPKKTCWNCQAVSAASPSQVDVQQNPKRGDIIHKKSWGYNIRIHLAVWLHQVVTVKYTSLAPVHSHDTRCLHGALQSVRPFFNELMVESPKSEDQRSVRSFSCHLDVSWNWAVYRRFFCTRKQRLRGVVASQFQDTPMLQVKIRVSLFIAPCGPGKDSTRRTETRTVPEQGANFSLQQKRPAYVTCKTQEQGAKPFACVNLHEEWPSEWDSSSNRTFAMSLYNYQ